MFALQPFNMKTLNHLNIKKFVTLHEVVNFYRYNIVSALKKYCTKLLMGKCTFKSTLIKLFSGSFLSIR